MTGADYRRLFEFYAWQSLVQRAGPAIPPELLRQIATATAHEIPAIRDPIGAVEFHIERILALARTTVAVERAEAPGAMGYTADMEAISHTWGQGQLCFTRLPACVCTCGRKVLMALDVSPHDD